MFIKSMWEFVSIIGLSSEKVIKTECLQNVICLCANGYFIFQDCETLGAQVMECITPGFNLPPDFLNWDGNTASAGSNSDFTVKIKEQTLDFYLGFILDDVDEYKNLSENINLSEYGKITVFTQTPEFDVVQDMDPFIPYSGMHLNIKVKCSFVIQRPSELIYTLNEIELF